jgi:eRF1 domain 3
MECSLCLGIRQRAVLPTLQDTLACLDMGAVDTLIVWESLDIQRLELRNPTTGASQMNNPPLPGPSHRSGDVGRGRASEQCNVHDRRSLDCSQHTACDAARTASVAIWRGWGAARLTGVSAATAGLL